MSSETKRGRTKESHTESLSTPASLAEKHACKCGYEWQYRGRKKRNKNYTQYIGCPRCHALVRL